MKLSKALRSSPAVLLITALLMSTGCTDSTSQGQAQSSPDNQAATMDAIKAANTKVSSVPGKPKQNRGVVKAVKMGGGYTYARVDISGEDFWLATAMVALQPGQEIAWKDYAMMTNFKSKALNQTFDQILFVDRVIDPTANVAAQRHGIVAESVNSAGYSFIRVEENGSTVWLAAPEIQIDVGQSVQWSGGGQMRNFTSRSLNRVFDTIIFVNKLKVS